MAARVGPCSSSAKFRFSVFKSFCDRTEVQLSGEGIAAMWGRTAAGSPNISDAITWVLGEQSAKSPAWHQDGRRPFLPARATRKPTGMAEVSLTLVDPEIYDGNDDKNDPGGGRRDDRLPPRDGLE